MAKHFQESDDWENETLTCPVCGWQGKFFEGEVETYDMLTETRCTKCGRMIATVSHIVDAEKFFGQRIDQENDPNAE